MAFGSEKAHQGAIIAAVSAAMAGGLWLGQVLDSIKNAHELSAGVRIFTTVALFLGTLILDRLLKTSPLMWRAGGQVIRVTRLRVVPWSFVLGAALLLWLPKLSDVGSLAHPEVPGSRAQTSDLRSLIPIFAGSEWLYNVVQKRQIADTGTDVHRAVGTYSETVSFLRQDFAPLTLAEVTMTGDVPEQRRCWPSVPAREIEATDDAIKTGRRVWLVADSARLFEECDESAAEHVASSLLSTKPIDEKHVPIFVTPMSPGSTWGLQSGTAPREDRHYQWHVESLETVRVPAGTFEGCMKVAYRTICCETVRWLCHGVGVAAWEYAHSGSVEQYRAELVDWKPRPPNN